MSVNSELREVASLLVQAYESRNWGLIFEAYERLTEQKIPESDIGEADVVKNLQREFEKLKTSIRESTKLPSGTPSSAIDPFDFSVKAREEKNIRQKMTNKFDPSSVIIDEEPGYDQINDNVKRTPRTRAPSPTINVNCNRCKKDFSISQQFYKDPYICDSCINKNRKLVDE